MWHSRRSLYKPFVVTSVAKGEAGVLALLKRRMADTLCQLLRTQGETAICVKGKRAYRFRRLFPCKVARSLRALMGGSAYKGSQAKLQVFFVRRLSAEWISDVDGECHFSTCQQQCSALYPPRYRLFFMRHGLGP